MKMRFLYLLMLVCCLSFSAAAQDTPAEGYKLRELNAGEYLDGILEVVHRQADFDNQYFASTVKIVISTLYPRIENEPWEKLLAVYDRLGIGEPNKSAGQNREAWNRAIIHAWLQDERIDLSQYEQIQFADYDIRVISRDFNTDGKNEYVLDVIKGEVEKVDRLDCNYRAEYVDYLIVEGDAGNHHVSRTTLPWFSSLGGGPFWRDSGGAIETRFEDINADGLPEWVVIEGGEVGGGPGVGYLSAGGLYIFGWRDETLQDLTLQREDKEWGSEQSLHYFEEDGGGCLTLSRDVKWDFVNLDDDAALEILQNQTYLDNWNCQTIVSDRFDWDAIQDRYAHRSSEKIFEDTQNCVQRQAEEIMWAGDYARAILIYEQALGLPQYLDKSESEYYQNKVVSLNQYLRARLALAYVLTQQPEKAQTLLGGLQYESYSDASVAYFVSTIARHIDNPFQACLAAFDAFTEDFAQQVYGITIEQYAYSDRPYLPENIGCNAPKMVAELFARHKFTTQQSPVEQIRALGTNAKKVLRFDLNNDGQSEWLIWLKSAVSPFFFAPDGEEYMVSQVELNTYLNAGEISTWALPENAGKAIVFKPKYLYFQNIPLWFGVYDSMRGGMGGDPAICITDQREQQWFTQFLMWRMDGNQLVPIFDEFLCREEVADLFPNGEGSTVLDGGTEKYDDGYDPVKITQLQYVWDSLEKTFERPPSPPVATSAVTATLVPQPKYYSVMNAFGAKDYEAIVEMTTDISLDDTAYSNMGGDYGENMLASDLYLRALALQQLGREQEAIEAFLQMIAVAPNETWKRLAMLYLEPV